ncbi:MAG: hypothetical protein KI790_10015 [Cyclobacteriaceae bacterium]|nr:hypothetical protein [Cyclobacteriaceae bacterium HetDA_MAG_MS6]
MKKIIFVLYGFFLFGLSTAMSQESTRRIDAKQNNQQLRIASGAATGQLSRKETKRLRHQQKEIRRMERRAESDGVVTRRERKQINSAQSRASKSIAAQKNEGNRF